MSERPLARLERRKTPHTNRLEIIAADHRSTGRSVVVARRFEGVRLLSLSHFGKAKALNAAACEACSEVMILPLLRPPLAGYLRDHLPRVWRPVPGSGRAVALVVEKALA